MIHLDLALPSDAVYVWSYWHSLWYLNVSENFFITQLSICELCKHNYRQPSNIRCTLVVNKIVNHSDVVGASPVAAAPTTSLFSTSHLASMDWEETTARQDENHLSFVIWCTYIRDFTVYCQGCPSVFHFCTHLLKYYVIMFADVYSTQFIWF